MMKKPKFAIPLPPSKAVEVTVVVSYDDIHGYSLSAGAVF